MLQIIISVVFSLLFIGCALIYGLCRTWSFRKLARLARHQRDEALPFVAPTAGIADAQPSARATRPEMSIVLATENDDWWVERHLPLWLQQETSFPFEVVVADASDGEDETRNIVQRLQNDYPNLRFTFVPLTHRNLYPRKLALTLGVRSARAPWVVVVTPHSLPASPQWLERMKQQCTEDRDVVVGYVAPTSDWAQPSAQLNSMEWQASNFRLWLKNRPASCEACNVALRKTWAVEQGLFTDSLNLPYGECALLTSHAATDRVALALHPDSFVQQPLPDEPMAKDSLQREQLTLRRRLAQRGIHPLRSKKIATTFFYLSIALFVIATTLRTLQSWEDANIWFNQTIAPFPFVPYDYWQILWDALPLLFFLLVIIQPYRSRLRIRRMFTEDLD